MNKTTIHRGDLHTTRICPVCGESYQADTNRLKHGRQTTCSRKCSYKLRAEKLSNSVTLTCSVCGKLFNRTPAQLEKINHTSFCSPECHYKGRSLGLSPRVITTSYDCYRKPDRECEICGDAFHPVDHDHKYCSRECFEAAHRNNMRGKNNPSYIDGRSYDKRGYRGTEWENIRLEVYRRDVFTCQECGKKCISRKVSIDETYGDVIQCHHIVPYRLTQNNSLENLITLCLSCHVKIEGKTDDNIDLSR